MSSSAAPVLSGYCGHGTDLHDFGLCKAAYNAFDIMTFSHLAKTQKIQFRFFDLEINLTETCAAGEEDNRPMDLQWFYAGLLPRCTRLGPNATERHKSVTVPLRITQRHAT